MKYIFLLIGLCISFAPVRAQEALPFSFITKINSSVSSFAVDNIGGLYIITPENQLKKYNEKGDSVA